MRTTAVADLANIGEIRRHEAHSGRQVSSRTLPIGRDHLVAGVCQLAHNFAAKPSTPTGNQNPFSHARSLSSSAHPPLTHRQLSSGNRPVLPKPPGRVHGSFTIRGQTGISRRGDRVHSLDDRSRPMKRIVLALLLGGAAFSFVRRCAGYRRTVSPDREGSL